MRTITRENQTKLNYPDKILKGSVEHRHFLLLNDLYEEISIKSMKKYFDKHKIGVFRTGVLVELEYIQHVYGREYRWIGKAPTIKDSIILLEALRKKRKEYLKTYIRKKNKKEQNETNVNDNVNDNINVKEEKEYIFTEKKSNVKDIPEIKAAIKSKHISLFWGMFKFEINK